MKNSNYNIEYSQFKETVETTENHSHTKILNLISSNSKVLELGSASGYMTRYLKEEKNCSIDIVELVPEYHEIAKQYANKSFCGSIESDDWQSALRGQSYDYITFADVLEHLIDPWEMLQKIEEFLKPNGKVLISYPNICHNDIIKGMFIDNFKYDKIGLRDKTHLRFFGLSDLKDLFKKSSLQIEHLDFTHTKTTEINKDLKIPFLLKYLLKRRKYGDVFQFIIKAGKQN